jgi:hypothetical protein
MSATDADGPTQEKPSASDLWDLVADDIGLGNRLYKNYVGMRDHATAPMTTRFAATTYYFSVKLKGAGDANAKKRPFDVLRLAWHDYPGEWFEESPSSEEEAIRRVDTFRSLLRSDVAFVLVDGQKLLDHKGDEAPYLKSLLRNLRHGLLQLKDDLLPGGERLVEFPRRRSVPGARRSRAGRLGDQRGRHAGDLLDPFERVLVDAGAELVAARKGFCSFAHATRGPGRLGSARRATARKR